MDSVVSATDSIGRLTAWAAQYGPFLFAVLFVALVPILGQAWFKKILQTKIAGGAKVREATIQVYKFYWISGVVFGLLLVAVTVAWWMFVQLNYVLPYSKEQFDKQVSAEFSKRVFEGVIQGADDDDIFLAGATKKYTIYLYPVRNTAPMQLLFAVLLSEGPSVNEPVELQYMTKRSYESLRASGANGFLPEVLKFCLSKDRPALRFVKEEGRTPYLIGQNENCGAKK